MISAEKPKNGKVSPFKKEEEETIVGGTVKLCTNFLNLQIGKAKSLGLSTTKIINTYFPPSWRSLTSTSYT